MMTRGDLGQRAAALSGSAGGNASRLALAITVFLALLPFAGWRLPTAWLAAMLVVIFSARLQPRRPEGQTEPTALGLKGPSWLVSLGYSAAALYLVMFHGGAAQTLGVTLFGVV